MICCLVASPRTTCLQPLLTAALPPVNSALTKAISTEAGDGLPHERRARNSQSCREGGVLSSCSPRELSCCSLISTVKSEFERVQEVACKSQEGAQTWLSRVTIATTHRQQLVEDARVHRRHVEAPPSHTGSRTDRNSHTHRSRTRAPTALLQNVRWNVFSMSCSFPYTVGTTKIRRTIITASRDGALLT